MNTIHVERVEMTIEEFCDKYGACYEGREWAIRNCTSMSDAWDKAKPEWLLWIATRQGVLTDKELRPFAVHCARSVEHLLTDQRSRDAIDVAERYANGEATQDELSAAWSAAESVAESVAELTAESAARSAAESSAWSAAWFAAWSAAWFAAQSAARSAARSAAWFAAQSAARSAAWSAAQSAARSAARSKFAEYLRANTVPCFEVKS